MAVWPILTSGFCPVPTTLVLGTIHWARAKKVKQVVLKQVDACKYRDKDKIVATLNQISYFYNQSPS